jgi:uncharacterized protein (DUF1697 family)
MIYVALLRAINLAGRNKVAMSDLRELVTRLGFSEVRTFIQSGNVVFRSDKKDTARLERLLEAETEKRLGIKVDYFVRSAEEWRAIVAANPFRNEARRDPGHLLVAFLKDVPSADDVDALRAAIVGREVVRSVGRQAYIVYPDGVGRSRLTSVLTEKKLGTRGTARNWNTVLKLGALAEG